MHKSSVMPEVPAMHRSQVGVVQLLDSEHGCCYCTTAASVWNGTSKAAIQRLLRRVRDHGRHQLRPPDALVYDALLRFTVLIGRRRPGSGLLRRLLYLDERRVQSSPHDARHRLAEVAALVGVSKRRSPARRGATKPLRVGANNVHTGYGGIRSQPSAANPIQPSVLHTIQQLFAYVVQWSTGKVSPKRYRG
jgi:hypothetical protein